MILIIPDYYTNNLLLLCGINRICKQFNGMTGSDLFSLSKRQLEQYCGPVDGRRLDGQITLSRNASGVSIAFRTPKKINKR